MSMASTSNQIASSSSSSTPPPRWNVFLSFRGKDTRKNFTAHLYSALDRPGIRTFMDDPELPRGEEISTQLLKAIQESKVSIVVFSKNYASSRWCLDELVKILECKRTMGQLVLPVFYDVDPSVVRHKKGSFAKAFENHKKRFETKCLCFSRKNKKRFETNMEIVEKWEGALTEAANLAGYDLQNDANGDEAKLIQKIVQKVLIEVNLVGLYVAKQPVGIESRVECITQLLSIDTNGIRRIGIYGMGGIGKTTIAKALFNKNFRCFEGSCFLANVREVSKHMNGKLRLQEQLLFDILKEEIQVKNVDSGISLLKERLDSKKVLIVLDDLDDLSQSDQLAGQWNQFASGSRIIITTRDIGVLDQIEVEERYYVKELDDDESLELFSRHAFKKSVPFNDYMEISKGIVRQAGGLPLALEILGSYMFNRRTMIEWRSSLDKLQQIPQHKIQEKLMISYDALGDGDLKDVFLDIACFFIGIDKEMTISILKSCGFNSENEITILIERCLLSINDKNELRMHDLLRDMGREIVNKEFPKEPEKRSRLWSSEDVYNVLKKQKGTKAIEGIVIPYERKLQQVTLDTETFKRMDNLRLLDIKGVRLTGNFEHIFEELRWLSWQGCDLQCLPSDFRPEKLVILDLRFSKINILWHDILFLKQLKILNLNDCDFLMTTPDFKGVPNLEKLHLRCCTSLVEIHQSIGHLSRLACLDLNNCSKLRRIPNSICNLRALESVDIIRCSNLEELPEELGNIKSLRVLKAGYMTITKLPDSIGRLSRLIELDLVFCRNLRTLPSSLCNLRVLESLCLNNCNNLEELPEELGNIKSLRVLKAGDTTITKLPDSIGRLSRLIELDLVFCRNLRTLPSSLCNLRVLESLNLISCHNLKELPEELENLESLRVLNLSYCRNLKNIPSSICKLPLRKLELCEFKISNGNFSDNIESLSSLKWLDLSSCKISDGNLLDNIGCLSSLEALRLSSNIFSTLPSSLGQLSNLKRLTLNNCRSLQSVQKLPPNLQELDVSGCTSMEGLLNLSNLNHLTCLYLSDCSKLVEIQGLEKLTSIRSIYLQRCNNLAITFTETFFQVYSSFGEEINIYLPTMDCPDWFGQQTKGTSICFDVPQNSENKFLGMIVWWVVSSGLTGTEDTRMEKTSPGECRSEKPPIRVVVENKTNGNKWTGYGCRPTKNGGDPRVSLIPKTQIAVKFGDKIEASGRPGNDFGVHLVYKNDTIENY